MSWRLLVALALVAATIVTLSGWIARRMTAPLGLLSAAALRFGRDVHAPPLQAIACRYTAADGRMIPAPHR